VITLLPRICEHRHAKRGRNGAAASAARSSSSASMYAVLGGRPHNSQTIWRIASRSRTHVDAIRVAHSVGPAAWVVPAPRVGQIRHRCPPTRSGHIGETRPSVAVAQLSHCASTRECNRIRFGLFGDLAGEPHRLLRGRHLTLGLLRDVAEEPALPRRVVVAENDGEAVSRDLRVTVERQLVGRNRRGRTRFRQVRVVGGGATALTHGSKSRHQHR
jgi:hypothetical protein